MGWEEKRGKILTARRLGFSINEGAANAFTRARTDFRRAAFLSPRTFTITSSNRSLSTTTKL